jgi:hypothetical protein
MVDASVQSETILQTANANDITEVQVLNALENVSQPSLPQAGEAITTQQTLQEQGTSQQQPASSQEVTIMQLTQQQPNVQQVQQGQLQIQALVQQPTQQQVELTQQQIQLVQQQQPQTITLDDGTIVQIQCTPAEAQLINSQRC